MLTYLDPETKGNKYYWFKQIIYHYKCRIVAESLYLFVLWTKQANGYWRNWGSVSVSEGKNYIILRSRSRI